MAPPPTKCPMLLAPIPRSRRVRGGRFHVVHEEEVTRDRRQRRPEASGQREELVQKFVEVSEAPAALVKAFEKPPFCHMLSTYVIRPVACD